MLQKIRYPKDCVLLSRDAFRQAVFNRDKHKCVICGNPAKDAHHIIERRLFSDGGYYLENGASLCAIHHMDAETTTLSCEDIREAVAIGIIFLPSHFYKDCRYDKWGNIILQNGTRLKGDLFFDESVQKVLTNVLGLFTEKVKYPRTHHLLWSPGILKDDRILESLDFFKGEEVIVTLKMDGENTSLYQTGYHARSINTSSHPSRTWVKNMHAGIAHNIPKGWRICGENLFAKHSIQYINLPSYFMGFSIWTDTNMCLSWQDTIEYFNLLDIQSVPVLYKGIWDEKVIKDINMQNDYGESEGYVVRVSRAFNYAEFRKVVGKFVRKNHISTHGHWIRQSVIPNVLKS